MNKKLPEFNHLIEIKEDEEKIYIYRVFINSKKNHLFTCADLPKKSINEDKKSFEEFAKILGENILFDSPKARKILKI